MAIKPLAAASFFCLIICISAYPQTSGVTRCEGDMTQVPVWTAPGSAFLIDNLDCDQTVNIIGLAKGYFQIRIGDGVGYVYAKYVRVPEIEEPEITEPEIASTAEEKEAKPAKVYRVEPRRHEGGLYFDLYHTYYAEPDFMRYKGFMWGASGDYTYRPNNFQFRLDGRFSLGDLDYWSSGMGIQEDVRHYNFETRFSLGYDLMASKKTSFVPYAGLGYRYLLDSSGGTETSSRYWGYDRKMNYLYSPIGMDTMFYLGKGWSLGITGEYDLFWHGWQYSEFGTWEIEMVHLIFEDCVFKNDQEDGWGTRASVKLIKNFGRIDFAMEPFFRYWNIEDSDSFSLEFPVDSMWFWLSAKEPADATTEWGIRAGIRF